MVTIKVYPVKSKSVVVGEASYAAYDSLDEACNHADYGLGEQKILDLVNAQVKTNAMNDLRGAKSGTPTKTALRNTAFNEIMVEMNAGEHQNVLGDEPALTALIERRISELEERAKAALPATTETSTDEE